jgi:hypothetical protein
LHRRMVGRRLPIAMSVAELIERIKALPPEELEEVRSFVLNGEPAGAGDPGVRFVNRERARELGEKILSENEELFRRLAQ